MTRDRTRYTSPAYKGPVFNNKSDKMANQPLYVATIFAVSLHYPIAFLVERGIANAATTLIETCELPEAEVYEWIAEALNDLLNIEVPKIHSISRASRREPMKKEVKYYSSFRDGLVHFVDFGAAGLVTHVTTHDDGPERMVVGALSSHPSPTKHAAVRKRSPASLKYAEDELIEKLDEAVEQGVWEVDTLILKGVRHVLTALREVEGPMVVTFPKLRPELARLKMEYLAKGEEERETQVMTFLQR